MIYVGNKKYSLYVEGKRREMIIPKPLPYDAELEYLESTGTQYIDTGLFLTNTQGIKIGCYPTSAVGSELGVFGASDSQRHNVLQVLQGRLSLYLGSVVAIWTESNIVNKYYNFSINVNNTHQLIVNGIYYSVEVSPYSGIASPVFLFCRSLNGAVKANSYVKARITHWSVYDESGSAVQDFIPVRVGQTGYMYDKVSGQLFGNSGTGDFVLGPDKN